MSPSTAYVYSLINTLRMRFEGSKDRGATAVEYGLMVGLIAAVIITVVALLGTKLTALFAGVAAKL